MTRKNRPRSSSLFLMELILAILFFSIASAACLEIFVKAHLMSAEAGELNQSVKICSNAAEMIAASPETVETGISESYFNEDFATCEKSAAAYILTVDAAKEDSQVSAYIGMSDTLGRTIYELETIQHIPGRTGYEEK